MFRLVVLFVLLNTAFACNASRLQQLRFAEMHSSAAVNSMHTYGVPASVILAQGILESRAGGSRLAVLLNNYFGIKCFDDCSKGSKKYHDSAENSDHYYRYFNSVDECFAFHGKLISSGRYENLKKYTNLDYISWAKGLQRCGYATDPNYARKLINMIKELNLSAYDHCAASSSKVESQEDVLPDVDATKLAFVRDTVIQITPLPAIKIKNLSQGPVPTQIIPVVIPLVGMKIHTRRKRFM